MAIFPFEDWQTKHLRLTVFVALGVHERKINWWEDITGVVPDEITSSPKKQGGAVVGTFSSRRLAFQFEADRIDWILAPIDGDLDDSGNPGMGPVIPGLTMFEEIVQKWLALPNLPPLVRMAFGAALFHPEEGRRQAYERLPSYVPVRVTPEHADFRLQINLPKEHSNVATNLALNRLSIWTVTRFSEVIVPLPNPSFAAKRDGQTALSLDLDINTTPDNREVIPSGSLFALYQELVEEGRKIAENGIAQE